MEHFSKYFDTIKLMILMATFAALTLPEFGGFLTIVVGMLAGFYGIVKFILDQSSNDRKADREERLELTEAIKSMAESNEKIALETKKGNDEAKERNGHLGEQNIQITELITAHTGTMVDKFADIQKSLEKQEVKEQIVEHQTIKEG